MSGSRYFFRLLEELCGAFMFAFSFLSDLLMEKVKFKICMFFFINSNLQFFIVEFSARILNSKLLIPLSRVSYCAYLINPVIILLFTMMNDQTFHINYYMIIMQSTIFTSLSFVGGAVFMLLFENPMIKIVEKLTKK